MPIPASRRSAPWRTPALLLAALSAFMATASAVPTDPTIPGVDHQGHLTAPGLRQIDDRVMLSPGAAWYPESEAATGAQGLAIVVMDLAPDGRVTTTTLAISSHASALDEQALRLASQLHWMGARKMPSRASLQVLFARDTTTSVQKKSCAELNLDMAWSKAHDPEQPPEDVGALRSIRGLVSLNTTWMPDRRDREAGQPVRDALFVASRRAIDECAAHPDKRLKDVFNHLLHEAAQAGEHAPATPAPMASVPSLPRSILHVQRDDALYAGSIQVLGTDPGYPAAALAAGAQGEVEVRAELGDNGAIDRIVVQRDYSGAPLLTDAALEIARRRLIESDLGKRDPATLPPAIVTTVLFMRSDSDGAAALDCATYRLDAAGWHGDAARLPDFQTLNTVLSMRTYGMKGPDVRRPKRDTTGFTVHDHDAQMQSLDRACAASPRKLAIDALIEVIDAM